MENFVFKLDKNLKNEFIKFLHQKNFKDAQIPSEHITNYLKSRNTTVSIFKTFKVLIQGNFASLLFDILELKEKFEEKPSLHFEIKNFPQVGFDESGKGDFFGPLVLCGFVLKNENELQILKSLNFKESKKATDLEVKRVFQELSKKFYFEFLILMPDEYNKTYLKFRNLNRMLEALYTELFLKILNRVKPEVIIVDQFSKRHFLDNLEEIKNLKVKILYQTQAEIYEPVKAASIVARAKFLENLELLQETFKVKLPKGAGDPVKKALEDIKKIHKKEILKKISKTNFKIKLDSRELF